MLVYAHVEPGLLKYDGFEPHQTDVAFRLLRSLIEHKKMIDATNAQIPATGEYINRIFASLSQIKIKNPPLEKELRQYIFELLGHRATKPPLSPAGIKHVSVIPDISSNWVDIETKRLWFDCIASATYEILAEEKNEPIHPAFATWSREGLAMEVVCSCPEVCQCLEKDPNLEWKIPVLTSKRDWDEFNADFLTWPQGLESIRIEKFARRVLGIPIKDLSTRRIIEFTPPCFRDVCREKDVELQKAIVDVVASRAYNCLRPEHHDEVLKAQDGLRRVRVKKMDPPARFHYYMNDTKIVFTMYENGDHDRGL